MSEISYPAANLQELFEDAWSQWVKLTGTDLVKHQFATTLESYDSVDSVTTLLQDRLQAFPEIHDGDRRRLMNALITIVQVTHELTKSVNFGEGIILVRCISSSLFLHSSYPLDHPT
jgi:hypothetical protein